MVDGDDAKLCELDRLLNDPEVPMRAARIWELAGEIANENARLPLTTGTATAG
ncbi:MAG: hypothetical protein NVSMB18_27500 [Acetobacteraceae bacterium]